ncbi:DUF898 family protein [Mangrovicoccus sp. HB161399]|uniref:DUF898 family protein n=1 Tax=Mangrovicoccus sp. HB161399 TaxID=2720392 RepID=UPI001556768B|nr:DUF898 family protein [Mangrovicoccus sp. HB161399]
MTLTEPDLKPPETALRGSYSGTFWGLFRLALWTSVLTLATLGLYRFWAKTRIRRHVWSAVAPGGDPFEYTGTGKEKFIGFLIAVTVLGAAFGILALGLAFLGFTAFEEETPGGMVVLAPALQNAAVLLAPLYFYAAYRARRYRMARTTWRGIRFGMEPGGWGYAWRASCYWLLVAATLGALWPLMTFKLEEYMAERSWFGDARWHQGGDWKMLYAAMKPLGAAILVLVLSLPMAVVFPPLGILGFLSGGAGLVFGAVHYRVQSFAILARHKTAGQGIRLGAALASGTVFGRIAGGWLAIGALLGAAWIAAAVMAFGSLVPLEEGTVEISGPELLLPFGLPALLTFLLWEPLKLALVAQPVLAHVVRHAWIANPILLTSVAQREGEGLADADGFADALDVGGVF